MPTFIHEFYKGNLFMISGIHVQYNQLFYYDIDFESLRLWFNMLGYFLIILN